MSSSQSSSSRAAPASFAVNEFDMFKLNLRMTVTTPPLQRQPPPPVQTTPTAAAAAVLQMPPLLSAPPPAAPRPTETAEDAALDRLPCPCQGSFFGPSGSTGHTKDEHVLWVAFLHYDNEEYGPDRCLRDYTLIPTNWLAAKMSGGNQIIHTQIFFWSAATESFCTVSVDEKLKCVYTSDRKEFARSGWTFVRLPVSKRQELRTHRFLMNQLGKSYNSRGAYMLRVWPQSGNGMGWFCSELATAALGPAGANILPDSIRPECLWPTDLYTLLASEQYMKVSISTNNPIAWKRRMATGGVARHASLNVVEEAAAGAAAAAAAAVARRPS